MLAPTTVLAFQHYETFKQRFAAFPVAIEMISRFRSPGVASALENAFIKHKPRYNILLRDDKTYPYIKVTTGEDWPRAFVTRRVLKDGTQ